MGRSSDNNRADAIEVIGATDIESDLHHKKANEHPPDIFNKVSD